VRGGAGTYYATDNWNELQFEVIGPPFYQSQTLNSDPIKPTLLMSNMLPSLAASPNLNPFSTDRHDRTPYVNQWSFGIERTFKQDYLLEVNYQGSTGQKLPQRRNLNIARLDPTGTIPISARVPFPQYGYVLLTYGGGWSSYNALTARLEKRFSSGFFLLASYTWQKALDLGSTDETSAISSGFKNWDKGHSSFDVPHRLVLSYIYELPFGRGKWLGAGANPVLNRIIGGWQLTGISTFSAGQYGTAALGVDWINLGSFTTSRPDIIGDYQTGRTLPDRYINTAAFDYPRRRIGESYPCGRERGAQNHRTAWNQQLGSRHFQEYQGGRALQRAVPLGDVQRLEPHAVWAGEPQSDERQLWENNEHPYRPSPDAVRLTP
jgi:hypothetical protein